MFFSTQDCCTFYFIGDLVRVQMLLRNDRAASQLSYALVDTNALAAEIIAANGDQMVPERIESFLMKSFCKFVDVLFDGSSVEPLQNSETVVLCNRHPVLSWMATWGSKTAKPSLSFGTSSKSQICLLNSHVTCIDD